MALDRWAGGLGVSVMVGIAIWLGWRAMVAHGHWWARAAVVVSVTVLTFGASYLALVGVLHPAAGVADPWLAWPPTPVMVASILLIETVIWVLAMLAVARRRAERQGRFHPEHRLPFQRPY